jgi:uncharacterized protein (DUF488 family)
VTTQGEIPTWRAVASRAVQQRDVTSMQTVVSIGVYGWTPARFLTALRDTRVGLVMDVRQRRGVRGSEYAWANSLRLQDMLAGAGIGYEHRKDLAPTTEMRQLQYREDARLGVGKRSRSVLAQEYRRRYVTEVLSLVDLGRLIDDVPDTTLVALLCVERDARACHRSLITERLAERFGVTVNDLTP